MKIKTEVKQILTYDIDPVEVLIGLYDKLIPKHHWIVEEDDKYWLYYEYHKMDRRDREISEKDAFQAMRLKKCIFYYKNLDKSSAN